MPAVIPVYAELRSALREETARALSLSDRLEAVIGTRPACRAAGVRRGRVDHSRPPWHPQAADAILDLHARARMLEARLRRSQGLPARHRGGSPGNTVKALTAVAGLCEAADDHAVHCCIRELSRWCRQAGIILDDQERPKRLPRHPGGTEPQCPFCGARTLRMLSLEGKIFCLDLDCTDADGRRPAARLAYSPVLGDWVAVWQDGVTGLPA